MKFSQLPNYNDWRAMVMVIMIMTVICSNSGALPYLGANWWWSENALMITLMMVMVNMIMIMILFLPGKGALLVVRERSGQQASRRHGSERSPAVLVNISLHCDGMKILTSMQPLWPGVFCLRYEIWTMYNMSRVGTIIMTVYAWWQFLFNCDDDIILKIQCIIFVKPRQPPWSEFF